MKKTILALAAFAALAMGCVKEQQPSDTPAEVQKTYLNAYVEDTKVSVDGKGVCSWQEGDVLAVWFVTDQETVTDENGKETVNEISGVRLEFTYESDNADGSAKFATTADVPEEFYSARAAFPASSVSSTGGFSLERNYTYDADSVPVYLRDYYVIRNEDGSLSSNLVHNASIMKFTLRDIPAYAAGFVLEFTGNVNIKTEFPYKTGYDEDIVLHSVAAQGRTPIRFYLIDGDQDIIEGTVKTFKEGTQPVDTDSYIDMGLVDFQKENLRKDYVKVCGIKWAKGNLVFDKDGQFATPNPAYQSGWGIYDEQWKYINYDGSLSTATGKYTNKHEYFDHFNYSGIGRRARFASVIMTSNTKKFEISGKVFSGYVPNEATVLDNMTQLSGDDRFTSAEFGSDVLLADGKELCGDVAFWATKGKYKLPTSAQLQAIGHSTTSEASFQFGYYMVGTVKVNGVLFTTPLGDVVRNTTSIEFTSADLESGLFLPMAGRRGPRNKIDTDADGKADNYVADNGYNSEAIINVGSQGLYRCGTFGSLANGSHENSTVLIINGSELKYGYTNGSVLKDKDGNYVDNTMSNRAGGSIRPVLVD